MTSPSLSLYKDKLFLDELHRRVESGAVALSLVRAKEGAFGQVKFTVNTAQGPYAFEAMAYPPPIKHL